MAPPTVRTSAARGWGTARALLIVWPLVFPAPPTLAAEGVVVPTARVEVGDLQALLRDNADSPRVLSGVDELFNVRDAPGFDAFDPEGAGASAGLNFEHIIAGHANPANMFAPRHGRYGLRELPGGSVRLVRKAADDPWRIDSTLSYTFVRPNYIDVEFRCIPRDATMFGRRGYAVFFFANYMNDVADVSLNFRGIDGPEGAEKWITADAPPGHPDYNGGGTYRAAGASALEYDPDHNFKLNLWSYEYPRYRRPFYFGRAAHDMTLALLFDRACTGDDEIRFSLFKFKLPRAPRPAWDWQYVIHRPVSGREYGFRARLVWKRFVSPEDCLAEYERWTAGLKAPDSSPP
jgi:hypothetical protein